MIKRIYLEITDACNMNCPFCTNNKGNNYMTLAEIEDYLEKIKPVCNYLYLHVLGEPLLHPEFNNILNLLDNNGFNLQLVTNGTLLDKYPDLLSHKCLRKLAISCHSTNNLEIDDKYYENILKLLESNKNTFIELRFYDYQNLDNKLLNFIESLKKQYGFTITTKTNSYKLKDNVFVYFNELFQWPSLDNEYCGDIGTCLGAKTQLAILHNGIVTTCCLDPKGHNKIGNLKETDLISIINSKKYQDIINNLNNNKITQELCKHCSYRLRFSKQ